MPGGGEARILTRNAARHRRCGARYSRHQGRVGDRVAGAGWSGGPGHWTESQVPVGPVGRGRGTLRAHPCDARGRPSLAAQRPRPRPTGPTGTDTCEVRRPSCTSVIVRNAGRAGSHARRIGRRTRLRRVKRRRNRDEFRRVCSPDPRGAARGVTLRCIALRRGRIDHERDHAEAGLRARCGLRGARGQGWPRARLHGCIHAVPANRIGPGAPRATTPNPFMNDPNEWQTTANVKRRRAPPSPAPTPAPDCGGCIPRRPSRAVAPVHDDPRARAAGALHGHAPLRYREVA
jgi:hypothetical protein